MGAAASVKKNEGNNASGGSMPKEGEKKNLKRKKRESFVMTMARAFGFVKDKASVIVIGLDNSGKTTLLNCLKPSDGSHQFLESTPTIGFTMEHFRRGKLDFKCFDMSGQGKYRSLWETYYKDAQGIIWVIDSTDHFRMCEVKDELDTTLNHPDVKDSDISILLFANKMDLPDALTPNECMEQLELEKIRDRDWHISACNAFTGDGVVEGIDWLSRSIAKRQNNS